MVRGGKSLHALIWLPLLLYGLLPYVIQTRMVHFEFPESHCWFYWLCARIVFSLCNNITSSVRRHALHDILYLFLSISTAVCVCVCVYGFWRYSLIPVHIISNFLCTHGIWENPSRPCVSIYSFRARAINIISRTLPSFLLFTIIR